MKLWILLLLSLFHLSACSDSDQITSSQESLAYRDVLNQADSLQEALAEGRLLRASSQRDRQSFENSLKEARYALILLGQNPNDPFAVQLGVRALREREQVLMARNDQAVVDDFYRRLAEIVTDAAARTGVDVEAVDWRMYATNFSGDIAPFGLHSTSSNWATGVSLDETYISVRGPSNKAWLLTPSFDLRETEKPSFRIAHQTRVDRNDRFGDAFNRVLINQTAFKAYVSTDYENGDPEKATWTRVSLGQMPASVDFHTVESPKIDLTPFKSEKTTIAFVFDADPKVIGSHYLTWLLYRFELFGRGKLVNLTPRASVLYEHSFTRSDLTPYQQLAILEGSPAWEPFGFNNNFRFAKIGSNNKEGETWLFSPIIRLRSEELLSLIVKETVLKPKFENKQILISANYRGGDPRLADWVEVPRTNLPTIDPAVWTDLSTGPFDLERFRNQEVVIAFRYTTAQEDSHVWEIETINITGLGERLQSRPLTLEWTPDWYQDPSDREDVLSFFDFSKDLQGFETQVVEGDPATWGQTTRANQTYLVISGHQGQKRGRTRFISPEVELLADQKNYFEIKQAINFYPSEHHQKGLVRILLLDGDNEIPLELERRPMGDNWNVIESERYTLPEQLKGKTIRVALEYAGVDDIFPNWNVHWIKLSTDLE